MITVLLFAAPAVAQQTTMPDVSFNGFGTFGLVHSDEDQADYTGNAFEPDGAGHTRDVSPEVDSRLGLQLSSDLTPRLSAVGQVIIEQRYDDTYRPTLEWANLKYEFTPELSVRVGRKVLPVFMTSGYRKVGYANPWLRPPQEVYRLVPVTNSDGIQLIHESRFGGFNNALKLSYGGKDTKIPGGFDVEADNGITIANTLRWDAATFFASYNRSRLTIEAFNPFFDAFRSFGPEGEAIADRYDLDDSRSEILTIGARYEPGDWFVMGEWARSENDSFIADNRGWYVTGGYRFGSVTPYITLADLEVTSDTSDPGLSASGPQAQQLNAALNALLGTAAEQSSVSLGARWDFARSAALKVQYDYIDIADGSPGVLVKEQPGFRRGGTVSLISASIDFVF